MGPADTPIAEKLRELTAGSRLERTVDRKREQEAVVAFYAGRNFAPLWIHDGVQNARAKAAVAHLRSAAVDGLDPADYATPEFKAGDNPTLLAEAEIRLTASVLTYARHAQAGRVHFSRISSEISYNHAIREPANVLAAIAQADNIDETLRDYNPPHAGYRALKDKLAQLRGQNGRARPSWIADGALLKIGMQDERVPLLRERLRISSIPNDRTYDNALAEAVKKFQQQQKLAATGNINSATLNTLNGARRDQDIATVIANMERWRWLPRDLGNAFSMLNIPGFALQVVQDGKVIWRTKVVVGKPSTPTPILSDTIKFITINPTWNVPPSIMNRNYLRQDPAVLNRMGIKVARNADGSLRMYQPPGDSNALGRIRFNFPNKFTVFQHDTPDKHLFAKENRAYSNGCMRVEDPPKYAEVLLSIASPKENYTQERLRKMYGGAERNIHLSEHFPVHLTYQTALIDESGKLVILEDIYGYDKDIQVALNSENRRFADVAIPVAHKHESENSQVQENTRRQHGHRQATGGRFFLE